MLGKALVPLELLIETRKKAYVSLTITNHKTRMRWQREGREMGEVW